MERERGGERQLEWRTAGRVLSGAYKEAERMPAEVQVAR